MAAQPGCRAGGRPGGEVTGGGAPGRTAAAGGPVGLSDSEGSAEEYLGDGDFIDDGEPYGGAASDAESDTPGAGAVPSQCHSSVCCECPVKVLTSISL